MAADLHFGDIGTIIRLTITDESGVVVDVSSASVKQVLMRSPSCADCDAHTATFTTNGTDGKIQYTTVSGDLHATGTWQIQGKVTISTGTWHSSIAEVNVVPNLD